MVGTPRSGFRQQRWALLLAWILVGYAFVSAFAESDSGRTAGTDIEARCAAARQALDDGDMDRVLLLLEGHDAGALCAQTLLLKAYRESYRFEDGTRAAARWLAATSVAPVELVEGAALLYAEAGRVSAALQLLDAGVERAPEQPGLRTMRARLRLAVGRCAEAVADADVAIAHGEATAARYYLRGAALAQGGDVSSGAAEAALLAALRLEPTHTLARFELGRLRLRQGRATDAAAAFRRVLQEVPGHAGALHNLGAALRRSGQHAEAVRALEKFQARNAVLEREKDLVDQLRNNQGNVAAERALALFLVDERRYQEATPLLRQLLRGASSAAPEARRKDGSASAHGAVHFAWAKVERARGKHVEAFAALQRALNLDATLDAARLELAEVAVALGRIDIAERALERCDPHADRVRWLLCRVRCCSGWKEREPLLREAVLAGSLRACREYAAGARSWPRRAQIIAALEEQSRVHEKHAHVHFTHGLFAVLVDDLARAERALRQAQQCAPWLPDVHEALAEVYTRAGRTEEAATATRRAAELMVLQ